MRVNDVKLAIPIASAERPRRTGIRGASAGLEGKHLNLDTRQARECLYLVADKASAAWCRRTRIHVRDNQCAHRRRG